MENRGLEKENLRKKYIEIRKRIIDKQSKSKKIINKIIDEEDFKLAKVVALYKSLSSEVDTTELIDYSMKKGKVVVLPRVTGNELHFYRIDDASEKLEKSRFGIYEPVISATSLINNDEIDLVIVPGICFDIQRNRVGFGKGYYDRLLANWNLNSIAICFDEQVLKNELIPNTFLDIKVKKIVTEEKVY